MLTSDREKLRGYFLESTREMLQANGIAAGDAEEPQRSGEGVVAAIIGFGGDVVRGTLTTLIPLALLRATHPAQTVGKETPEDDAVDWAGEFANQLLGRIKHKLLPHGVVLSLSTPKTMFAESLRLSSSVRGLETALGFRSGEMRLGMWLDCIAEGEQEIFGEVVGEVTHAPEGDLMFF